MTYTRFPTDELVMIEAYYHQSVPVVKIEAYLKQTKTPIYTVINFSKEAAQPLSNTVQGN